MKKSLSLLAGIILIVCVVYTATWWVKSNHLKNHLVTLIADINRAENRAFQIEYDAIESKGFPLYSEANIKNLRFIFTDKESKINAFPLKITVDGSVTVGSPLFINKAWIALSGKTHIMASDEVEGGQLKTEQWILDGQLTIGCDCAEHFLLTDENVTLSSSGEFIKWATELTHDFSITAKHLSLTEISKDANRKIYSLKDGLFLLNQSRNKDLTKDVSLDLKLEKLILYPNLKWFQNSQTALSLSLKDKADLQLLSNPTENDLVFQAHLTLPAFDSPFFAHPSLETLPTFAINVDRHKWSSKSALWSLDGNGNLEAKNEINDSFKFYVEDMIHAVFTETYHTALLETFDLGLLAAQKKHLLKDHPVYEKFLLEHHDEIRTLIPDLSQFGKITYQIDFDFSSVEKEPTPLFEDISVKLGKLGLASDLYGVALKGGLKGKKPLYDGDLSLKLINYQALIQDAIHYYNRWEQLLVKAKVVKEDLLPKISDTVTQQTLQFLKAISDHPDAQDKDLETTFVLEHSEPSKVGTLTFGEFAQKGMMWYSQVHAELYPTKKK